MLRPHTTFAAARNWATSQNIFRCYHCGFTATNDTEATNHFGKSDRDIPACLQRLKKLKALILSHQEKRKELLEKIIELFP